MPNPRVLSYNEYETWARMERPTKGRPNQVLPTAAPITSQCLGPDPGGLPPTGPPVPDTDTRPPHGRSRAGEDIPPYVPQGRSDRSPRRYRSPRKLENGVAVHQTSHIYPFAHATDKADREAKPPHVCELELDEDLKGKKDGPASSRGRQQKTALDAASTLASRLIYEEKRLLRVNLDSRGSAKYVKSWRFDPNVHAASVPAKKTTSISTASTVHYESRAVHADPGSPNLSRRHHSPTRPLNLRTPPTLWDPSRHLGAAQQPVVPTVKDPNALPCSMWRLRQFPPASTGATST